MFFNASYVFFETIIKFSRKYLFFKKSFQKNVCSFGIPGHVSVYHAIAGACFNISFFMLINLVDTIFRKWWKMFPTQMFHIESSIEDIL